MTITKMKPLDEFLNAGILIERIEDDDPGGIYETERQLVLLWEELNTDPNGQPNDFLSRILTRKRQWDVIGDDRAIAATLIQRLGSNIGQSFVTTTVESRSLRGNRGKKLSRLFRDQWIQEYHIHAQKGSSLQVLFSERLANMGTGKVIIPISKREVTLADRLMTWIGTDEARDIRELVLPVSVG